MIDINELRRLALDGDLAAMQEIIHRLEAAENGAAHQKALADSALRVAEGWERKCGELRTKIEQMERQEPVAFALYSGWARKAVYLSEIEACEQRDRRQLTADLSGSLEAYRVEPLYALPGAQAQPAPFIPEGWKLVPIVSTAEMDNAGAEHCDGYLSVAEAVWDAMLAAAPDAKP